MLQKSLEVFVSAVLPLLVTWLAAVVTKALHAWEMAQRAKLSQTTTSALLTQLAALSELVVSDIEVNERAAIKEVTADGHISKADGDMLKAIAVQRLKALAKERGFEQAQAFLAAASPAAGSLLSGLIEKAVSALDAVPPPAPVPVVVAPVQAPVPAASP